MSSKLLKAVMESKKKTVANVASDTGLGINTINRYLKGETVHVSTEKLLEFWVNRVSKDSGGNTAA